MTNSIIPVIYRKIATTLGLLNFISTFKTPPLSPTVSPQFPALSPVVLCFVPCQSLTSLCVNFFLFVLFVLPLEILLVQVFPLFVDEVAYSNEG
jgi:hypothetical protein